MYQGQKKISFLKRRERNIWKVQRKISKGGNSSRNSSGLKKKKKKRGPLRTFGGKNLSVVKGKAREKKKGGNAHCFKGGGRDLKKKKKKMKRGGSRGGGKIQNPLTKKGRSLPGGHPAPPKKKGRSLPEKKRGKKDANSVNRCKKSLLRPRIYVKGRGKKKKQLSSQI